MRKTQSIFRIAPFLLVVLLAANVSLSQSSVNIYAGSFVEVVGPFGSDDTFAFQIAEPGTSASAPIFYNGDSGEMAGGFSVCDFGCTVAQITQIGKSSPLSLFPNGTLFGFDGVPLFCWGGGGSFNFSSGFSYQIKSGVLTAQGNVTPNVTFTPADLTTCNANGMPSLVVSGTWKYVAQFTRLSGKWYLALLQIHPTI